MLMLASLNVSGPKEPATPKDEAGTYNKINSPGHAYMKEDGEWP
jgi:hypothetical protein